MPAFSAAQMKDPDAAKAWFDELSIRLTDVGGDVSQTTFDVEEDTENESSRVKIITRTHGITNEKMLAAEFFESGEYQSIKNLGGKIADLFGAGAYVQRGEKTQQISSFKLALNWLMEEAKRGQYIQRYKGLGEMNPEQLWETTVNPESRRLLQVKVEDAVAADEIFTTLMGDQVEPRRDFIEKNALSVSNLDI